MKITNKYNICNFYILLWCIYLSQGSLGIKGGMIPQLLLVVILTISVYYVYYAIRYYNIGPYLNAAFVFFTILEVYGVFLIISGERITFGSLNVVNKITYLKDIANSILPIFPFYVFARKGLLTEKMMKRWVWVLLVVATSYFFTLRTRILMAQLMMDSGVEDITNNASYFFLSLLPFTAFFRHKPQLQFAMMGYCMLFLLSGFKRGAILVGVLVLVIITFDTIKRNKGNYKIKSILLTGVLIVIGLLSVQHFLNTSDYFITRIDDTLEGDSSGRDRIYSALYYHFIYDTNIIQFFFGSGALTSVKIAGNYAHNDWLELVVNQGLLGIVAYAIYWRNFYKEWRYSDRAQPYSLALGTLIFILFLKSFFSMSYGDMDFYTTMLLGYCVARCHFLKNEKNDKGQIRIVKKHKR